MFAGSKTNGPAQVTVRLRRDQSISDINSQQCTDKDVIIFAPEWVKNCLNLIIAKLPQQINVKIEDQGEEDSKYVISKEEIGVKLLNTFARNEAANVTGIIDFNLYDGIDKSIILSIKDLARQCIIIGMDQTTYYGGHPKQNFRVKQDKTVLLIDLIGLQFQKKYNTGRLVIINDKQSQGILDEIIYENIVGQPKKKANEIIFDKSNRYIPINQNYAKSYFDTIAYEMFVANDFLLVCQAINQINKYDVNLKFLKYGCGFSAGPFTKILEGHICKGIVRALQMLSSCCHNSRIRSMEFPFYPEDRLIQDLCLSLNIECIFSAEDALKQTTEWLTATTNCANAHSVTGNEMGFSSVNSALAENLISKAYKFSPIINNKMKEQFIELSKILIEFNSDRKPGKMDRSVSQPTPIPRTKK